MPCVPQSLEFVKERTSMVTKQCPFTHIFISIYVNAETETFRPVTVSA